MPTKIEWAEETWNPITGCTKVSEGCCNCYAERMAKRLRGRFGYPKDKPFRVTLHPDRLDNPLRWRRPRRVFVCSMGDLFHEDIEILDSTYVRDVFAVMVLCRHHNFMILTKRPHVAAFMLTDDFGGEVEWAVRRLCAAEQYYHPPRFEWPLPNVWLGTSVEDQWAVEKRLPLLASIPAVIHFISYEPALGMIDIDFPIGPRDQRFGISSLTFFDWVIAGGESGPGARPAHPEWFRQLRDQCQEAGIPFFFKQWGAWEHSSQCVGSHTAGKRRYNWEDNTYSIRIGKKAAGRLLDGRTWDEYPQVV